MRNHNRNRVREQRRMPRGNVQTTLRLPEGLYIQAKAFVEGRSSGSVNELIVKALTAYLRAAERKAIDDDFKPMAEDGGYRKEALRIGKEFAAGDAESIEIGERELAEL